MWSSYWPNIFYTNPTNIPKCYFKVMSSDTFIWASYAVSPYNGVVQKSSLNASFRMLHLMHTLCCCNGEVVREWKVSIRMISCVADFALSVVHGRSQLMASSSLHCHRLVEWGRRNEFEASMVGTANSYVLGSLAYDTLSEIGRKARIFCPRSIKALYCTAYARVWDNVTFLQSTLWCYCCNIS